MRLAIVASHPIQYQAPLFRELTRWADLHVFFAHRADAQDQAAAGFNVAFDWDIDLLSGFAHTFLKNVARRPGLQAFGGCDTPSAGTALVRFAPDAVLVMGWHLKCFWQSIWAAKRARIPVMVRGDSHLETPRTLLKRVGKAGVYPLALRTFDAALYVGEKSRRYWEHYSYPKSRMFFSPHCVDNDWFAARAMSEVRSELRARHGLGGTQTVALFAGKLVPFKRPLDLVAAAALLKQRGIDIVVMIAGAGPLESEVRAAAASAGIRLVPLGFCNQTEMPAAYRAADLLVLPSDGSETWGLVCNEALACGTPIAVSNVVGCAPDLASDGEVGRSFRVANVPALAEAIAATLYAPPSAEAIRAVSDRYSLSAAVDGVVEAACAVALSKPRMA